MFVAAKVLISNGARVTNVASNSWTTTECRNWIRKNHLFTKRPQCFYRSMNFIILSPLKFNLLRTLHLNLNNNHTLLSIGFCCWLFFVVNLMVSVVLGNRMRFKWDANSNFCRLTTLHVYRPTITETRILLYVSIEFVVYFANKNTFSFRMCGSHTKWNICTTPQVFPYIKRQRHRDSQMQKKRRQPTVIK